MHSHAGACGTIISTIVRRSASACRSLKPPLRQQIPCIPRSARYAAQQVAQFVIRRKGNAQRKLHHFRVHFHGRARRLPRHGAATVGFRSQPRVADFNPAARCEPWHAVDVQAFHFARMKALMGAEPVVDAVVDPAVEHPEHRVHVRRERVGEKVVFRLEPALGEVIRAACHRHRLAIGRVARHRGPAHVQPVVQLQLDLRAELPQRQLRQKTRIAVLRFPHLKMRVVRLVAFDVADQLRVLLITLRQPVGRQGAAVVIVEVAGKAQPVTLQLRLRQRKARPRRQVLNLARLDQHVPVHVEKVFTRPITVLARSTGITFFVAWPRLPADTAQGIAFILGQFVPFVPRRMPELVKQAMLPGNQPGQKWRTQSHPLPRFGENLFDGDQAVFQLRQGQWPIQSLDTPAERAAAGIAERAPDFIEGQAEFVIRGVAVRIVARMAVHDPQIQFRGIGRLQVADHPEARHALAAQLLGRVDIAAQAAPTRGNVEKHFQALQRSSAQSGITTLETQGPHATQFVGQTLSGGVRRPGRGLARRHGFLDAGEFAVRVISSRKRRAGQRQPCHEPSSRNRHCLPVPTRDRRYPS
ncbi:Unknown protein sequence [Pseudomonas syringae pv. maculicola]|nr:Unknown protein sequence [Pseudomonas syringae pv. maculicola]